MMGEQSEERNTNKLFLVVGAIILGAILAEVSPIQKNNAVSGMQEKESVVQTNNSKKEVKKQATPELTYVEQVNEQIENGLFPNRMPIKLMLQTDDQWKETAYGSGNVEGNTLELNGCAILSLAMVASYLDNQTYVPKDILDWSKEDYYSEGEGTQWIIFSEFAKAKGYQFENLGEDIQGTKDHLNQKHPIIVSVQPGLFTETGHILVLTGFNKDYFWLNDPNDSAAKGYSKRSFKEDELLAEAVNFWAIYK